MQKTLPKRINAKTSASFAPWLEKFLVLILLLQCVFNVQAQKYSFKNYTVADGLGSSSVNHIFQDSKGYLWFATQGGGASRFNGKDFVNFTKEDGLINNDVTYITEDPKGNIWIGTAEGASAFNGVSFRNYNRKQGFTDGVVYCIYADEKNKVWFALSDEGVKIFDGKKFDSLTTDNGLPSNSVYTITRDNSANYWFGISEGIAKYSKGKVTSYRDSAYVKENTFFSSLLDSNGNVWFGSTAGKVVIIGSDGRPQNFELPSPVQNDFIGGITQDKNGNVWFATDHGLLKYDGGKFKLFSEHEGLSVNIAQTVMCDYEGNIWAGTLSGGVNLFSSEAFVHYADKDGLTSGNVICIHPDPSEKRYYIGTGDGLFVFTPTAEIPFKKIISIAEINNTNVITLSVDENGLLWLATQEGVFVLEKKKEGFALRRRYTHINGERIVSPTKIIHDLKGNCWIATYGSGIFLINGDVEKSFNTKNGFLSDNMLTVFEDAQSNIWFGSQDAGIIKFDGNEFHPLLQEDSLTGKSVWSITEDGNGNIFWGTGESGFYRYDGHAITNYDASDGLSSNYITAIQWNKYDNSLWLGSERSLNKIAFTDNYKIKKNQSYKEQHGFNSIGINHEAIEIDKEGLTWLGTVNGLWLYNQDHDLPKHVSPKILLTGIRLFYQDTDWGKLADSIDSRSLLPVGLNLPYNKNHLTFDVKALTTQEVYYTFKLEGQDQEWSSLTNNNEITYSNISPGGQYTFVAKAVNSEDSSQIISFSFSINPPWWSTWWFRSLIFLVLVSSLVAVIKARERVLKEQNVKLEETVKQRTLEIEHQKEIVEQTLSEKEGLLHEKEILLKEIHHRVKNNLQTISSMLMLQGAALNDEHAKKAITESQNRVRSIALVHQKLYQTHGLEKIELNGFIKDLTEQVRSLYNQQSKQVSFNLNIPETHLIIDTAIPLGLILNELLTNSFKYAFNDNPKGEISMELISLQQNESIQNAKKLNKRVKLTYWDSGPGLDLAMATGDAPTLGLRLINLLSQQIGATLNYSRTNGSEYNFTFGLGI